MIAHFKWYNRAYIEWALLTFVMYHEMDPNFSIKSPIIHTENAQVVQVKDLAHILIVYLWFWKQILV